MSVCPNGCVCHAVRAPGSKVTIAPLTRAGSLPLNGESMRTVPVNQSAGPLLEGCEPILLISILSFFHCFLFGFYLLASLTAPGVLAGTGSHSRPHPPAG